MWPHTWRLTPAWDLLGFVPVMNKRPCYHSLCYPSQHTSRHPCGWGTQSRSPSWEGACVQHGVLLHQPKRSPCRLQFAHLWGWEAHHQTHKNPEAGCSTSRARPPGAPRWVQLGRRAQPSLGEELQAGGGHSPVAWHELVAAAAAAAGAAGAGGRAGQRRGARPPEPSARGCRACWAAPGSGPLIASAPPPARPGSAPRRLLF